MKALNFDLHNPDTHPELKITVELLNPEDYSDKDRTIIINDLIPGIKALTGLMHKDRFDMHIVQKRAQQMESWLTAARLRYEVAELTLQKERLQKDLAA